MKLKKIMSGITLLCHAVIAIALPLKWSENITKKTNALSLFPKYPVTDLSVRAAKPNVKDLVVNGGFESGTLDNFAFRNASVTPDAAINGSYGVQMNADGHVSQELAGQLEPGTPYIITAKVKVVTSGTSWGSPRLRMSKYPDLGTSDFGTESVARNSTASGVQSLQIDHTFTNAELTGNVHIGVRNFGFNGVVHVDDISVVLADAPPPNQPPAWNTVDVSPTSGTAPLEVTLSASASDPDGTVREIRVDYGDGQQEVFGANVNTTHIYHEPGSYTLTLTAVDDEGAGTTETVPITVTDPGGGGETVNLVQNGGFEEGTAYWETSATMVNGQGRNGSKAASCDTESVKQVVSGLEPGVPYKATAWFKINAVNNTGSWGYLQLKVSSYDWQDLAVSSFTHRNRPLEVWFKEVVTFVPESDGRIRLNIGFYGDNVYDIRFLLDDIEVFKKPAVNNAPTLSIESVAPVRGDAPITVDLTIAAGDKDGALQSVTVDYGDGAVDANHPYASFDFSHTYLVPGDYTLKVAVGDDEGKTVTSSQDIWVTDSGNHQITINTPTAGSEWNTSSGTIRLGGEVFGHQGDLFWINEKTLQSGYFTASGGQFNTPDIGLLPGSNILAVQSMSDYRARIDRLTVNYTPDGYQGPVISNFTGTTGNVGRYEKWEATFDISTIANNLYFPYDDNLPENLKAGSGITVDVIFSNGNKTLRQPAFYNMPMEIVGGRYLAGNGKSAWTVRMAFDEPGSWSMRIEATDRSGTTTWAGPSISVAESDRKGFVKTSDKDNRYFEFDNGESFVPMGYGTGVKENVQQMDDELTTWRDNKLNFGRWWLSSISPPAA